MSALFKKLVNTAFSPAGMGVAAAWLAASAVATLAAEGGLEIRSPWICAVPDGGYLLAGADESQRPDGSPDLHNNAGVKAWRSADLKTWQPIGYVYDLRKDFKDGHEMWQGEMAPIPGGKPGERGRAMTFPQIHFDGKKYWLSYSMNGYAAGLAEFEGAPGEGRVKDYMIMAEAGGSETGCSGASLFIDSQGGKHLVWGGGCVARVRPDLASLMGHGDESLGNVGVTSEVAWLPGLIEGAPADDGLPEHGPPYGASLVEVDGRVLFVFSAKTFRDGGIHEDAYACAAASVRGPFGKPALLVPDGGAVSVFKANDGSLRVAYASAHPAAANYRKLTIATVTLDGTTVSAAIDKATLVNTPPPLIATPNAAGASSHPEIERPTVPADVPILMESVRPLFDHPLRHTAILKAPDGNWYLTGTESTERSDGTRDWANNRGVHLWKSPDGKQWTDLGYVWEIERDAKKSPKSAWQLEKHMDLTCGAWPTIGRGITAPEIHYLKDTFWITYSMNGQGTGLLKSTTGKAEGPYADMGRITRQGRDASILQDTDGKIYWVWGEGFVAPMKEDLTGLAGPARALFTNVKWYPRYYRRPELMGQWGSHVIRVGEWYIWTFATRTGRFGNNTIDTFASWSKSLDGPWGEPCLAVANSSQVTIVPDGSGGYMTSVSGEDEHSQCAFLPAMTAIGTGVNAVFSKETGKEAKPASFNRAFALTPYSDNGYIVSFSAVETDRATSLDLWAGYPDLLGTQIRDVTLARDDDGAWYLGGSLMWEFAELYFYRSKNKLNWEKVGPFFKSRDIVSMPGFNEKELRRRFDRNNKRPGDAVWDAVNCMEMKIHRINGQWYISGNPAVRSLLKSTTGKITGPYEAVREVPGACDIFQDEDGTIIHNVVTKNFLLKDIEKDPFTNPKMVTVPDGLQFTQDCEAGIIKIDGYYVVYTTDWTGSYDQSFTVSKSLDGPWSRPRVGCAYGGNGYLMKDRDGSWWFGTFMNVNDYGKRAPMNCRALIYPVFAGMEKGEFIIEPLAVRANRSKLERMGALWQSPR